LINNSMKKYKNKKRKRLLFVKTFSITALVVSVVMLAGWFSLQSFDKPPSLPERTHKNKNKTVVNAAEPQLPAYETPDPDADDLLIGDGLYAPEGFTDADRKPLFYTFLIFGLDEGINTDTIMVASYDGVKKEANIIGIPRDGKVNVKRNLKKINAAYPAGRANGGGMDGVVDQLGREIKTVIGFVPDFYICVNFKAFVKMIDAIGGVNVNVPYDMVYDDPVQSLHVNIKKGEDRLLTGEQALHFARYRKGNSGYRTVSDYERIKNQQTIISATVNKLLQPVSILRIPEFISIFNENVSTNLKATDLLWFAKQITDISGGDALHSYTIPIAGSTGLPNYYELFDAGEIIELINQTINPFKKDIELKDIDIAS